MAQPLLEVKDLKVHFPTDDGLVKAVDGVSYSLAAGETLGIVGESGSGKSVSSLTVMGLINPKQATISGEVLFQGQDLLKLPRDEMRTIRGEKISMIFQDPMTSLHPFYKVGYQIAEAILELERWYQADFRISDQALLQKHLDVEFNGQSLDEVLSVIGRILDVRLVRRGDAVEVAAPERTSLGISNPAEIGGSA